MVVGVVGQLNSEQKYFLIILHSPHGEIIKGFLWLFLHFSRQPNKTMARLQWDLSGLHTNIDNINHFVPSHTKLPKRKFACPRQPCGKPNFVRDISSLLLLFSHIIDWLYFIWTMLNNKVTVLSYQIILIGKHDPS